MGGIDAMTLASALPDPISASGLEICLLLTGALAICALAIATASMCRVSFLATSQAREMKALLVHSTHQRTGAAQPVTAPPTHVASSPRK